MTRESITPEYVREVFDYCPETGLLTWRKSGGRRNAGEKAGWIQPDGRRQVGLRGRHYFAHRLIWLWMTGKWPDGEIDHENHLPDDNRWVNLRDVVKIENGRNQPKKKNNQSGITGVFWNKANSNWNAQIMVDGKGIHLGCFRNLEDAALARKKANIKYGFHENHGISMNGGI